MSAAARVSLPSESPVQVGNAGAERFFWPNKITEHLAIYLNSLSSRKEKMKLLEFFIRKLLELIFLPSDASHANV